MNKNNICSILFVLSLFVAACSKSDVNSTYNTPQIKTLTASKLEIKKSSVKINTTNYVVEDFELDENMTFLYLILDKNGNNWMALSLEDEELDGKTTKARINGIEYEGQNFEIKEQPDESHIISGDIVKKNTSSPKEAVEIILYESSIGNGNSTISIDGTTAKINGTLGNVTYNQILDLNAMHKNVHTILFEEVEGSVNDDINVETGRLIRKAGYTTAVNSNSEIYSGGVDLFCAGLKRTIENGATLGVHSWCCGENGEDASQIPDNDSQHHKQINYFNEMLGSPLGKEFYFFTIKAASSDDIHIMTNEEINTYKLKK